jgi:hypothetical protein
VEILLAWPLLDTPHGEARDLKIRLRLIVVCGPSLTEKAAALTAESSEIIAMLTVAINTARRNAAKRKKRETLQRSAF